MKKIFKFMMILVVGLGFIACTPVSNGPGYVEPPVETETPPETPPEITYEVKFELVGEDWLFQDGTCDNPLVQEKSDFIKILTDYYDEHTPTFETKTLKENEEYILEDKSWISEPEGKNDFELIVQYFADEELTSSIEPGSMIKNENKTIYIKFVYFVHNQVLLE